MILTGCKDRISPASSHQMWQLLLGRSRSRDCRQKDHLAAIISLSSGRLMALVARGGDTVSQVAAKRPSGHTSAPLVGRLHWSFSAVYKRAVTAILMARRELIIRRIAAEIMTRSTSLVFHVLQPWPLVKFSWADRLTESTGRWQITQLSRPNDRQPPPPQADRSMQQPNSAAGK